MFTRSAFTREIFMNKRKLKGKWLLISEGLKSSQMQLFGEAQKKYRVEISGHLMVVSWSKKTTKLSYIKAK